MYCTKGQNRCPILNLQVWARIFRRMNNEGLHPFAFWTPKHHEMRARIHACRCRLIRQPKFRQVSTETVIAPPLSRLTIEEHEYFYHLSFQSVLKGLHSTQRSTLGLVQRKYPSIPCLWLRTPPESVQLRRRIDGVAVNGATRKDG